MKTRKKDRKGRKFANLREQIKESPVKFAVYLETFFKQIHFYTLNFYTIFISVFYDSR